MNDTEKLYIGTVGRTGKTVHAVAVHECEDGKSYTGQLFQLCHDNPNSRLRITRLHRVQATKQNVTCHNCLKYKAVA